MKPRLVDVAGGRPPYELSPVYWAGASLKLVPSVGAAREVYVRLSPVYWAGASLKQATARMGGGDARTELSPVYWAGASLKRRQPPRFPVRPTPFPGLLGRGLIEAEEVNAMLNPEAAFPRSTGPGPH